MISAFQKRKKIILAGLLTFVLMLNISVVLLNTSADAVSKSELNALKKQQAQLADQKADVQKQADVLNSKVATQKEKLNVLNKQLSVTNSQLENLSEQITIYTNSIAQMEDELNRDEQQQQMLIEKYKKRIQEMEESGSSTYIAVLLGATSPEDLLGRIDFLREIMEYDNGLIQDVKDSQVKVQNAKADMEAQMAEQEEVFASYKDKQADLVAQQGEVKAVLSSLTADSADYQQQLDSLKSLQSSISGKIDDMEDKLAEQERIRAEQEAAKQASDNNSWYGDSAGTGTGQDIVDYAKQFLGVPYVYGGTSPSGFDCSGLVYYCYKHFGYKVNRTASGLAFNGKEVSSSSLQVGDVILFTAQSGGYIGHTGIYIGGGKFIHAPHTGDVVKISSLSDSYYKNHYWGARRIVS